MRSCRYHSVTEKEEKEAAAKEKNKRYILYWLPPNNRYKRVKGDVMVGNVLIRNKNSWEYWEYSISDGHPLSRKMAGHWPGYYRSFNDLAFIPAYTGYPIPAKRFFFLFSS